MIIAVASSTNTREAEERLHKLETELQNFNHSSESDLQECSRKIKNLEEDIIAALKTANQSKVYVNSNKIENKMPVSNNQKA